MPNRNGTQGTGDEYRYSFQGQERDDEIKGKGNSYNFGNRMHDPRIGRFFSTDRLEGKFAYQSPYIFAGNTPIMGIDKNGDSLYVLIWVERGKSDDEMFRASAWTRKRNIENSSNFDPTKDKVFIAKVSDLNDIAKKTKWAKKKYSKTFGKTREFGLWSHSGFDGPIGGESTGGGNRYSKDDDYQMSLKGWNEIDFNWGDSGQEEASFYGCHSSDKGSKWSPTKDFGLNISNLDAYEDITVRGQDKSSFPSTVVDKRIHTSSMDDGEFKGKEVYMVGSDGGAGDVIFNQGYKMTESKNGKSTGASYQPGRKAPKQNSGGGCFSAGTEVAMWDGTKKRIEDIVVGDTVKTYDIIKNSLVDNVVLETTSPISSNLIQINFIDDLRNTNTSDHPYYIVGKGWCSYSPELTQLNYGWTVKKMNTGDTCLFLKNGVLKELIIQSIFDLEIIQKTYNLSKVENTNNFFANGILVHNKKLNITHVDEVHK